MRDFVIKPLNQACMDACQLRVDNLTDLQFGSIGKNRRSFGRHLQCGTAEPY